MPDTLGSLRAEILLELRGDLNSADDQPLINSKINNALENIFMAMMKVQVARFLGEDSPVTVNLTVGTERLNLVSIADPLVAPVLAQVAAGNLAQRTINVEYTLVSESGSETLPSPQSQLVVNVNNLLQVNAPANPGNAFGWNVYAGQNNLALQNQQPLPFSIANWQEPATGVQDYPDAQTVPPITNTTADNIAYIKHLEIITSDTLRRAWNQYDIDSEIGRRYGRTLSSASEFQTYVWDLINGHRLEFRPPMGLTFSPRYFYIAKPRRLRYDQAEIPYQNISGVHDFLVNYAIGQLKLALDEYLSSQGYTNAAKENKAEIISALTQEDWSKNTRVVPHLF